MAMSSGSSRGSGVGYFKARTKGKSGWNGDKREEVCGCGCVCPMVEASVVKLQMSGQKVGAVGCVGEEGCVDKEVAVWKV